MTVRTDTGPFSIVPEWVILEGSANAVKLYAVLGRFADHEGHGHPGRQLLAQWMRCSEQTIDRTIKELVELGAVEVQARFDDAGDRTSNDYLLHRMRRGGRTSGGTGGSTSVEVTRTTLNEIPLSAGEPPHSEPSTPQELVAFYADEAAKQGVTRIPGSLRARVGAECKRLLHDGFQPDLLRPALRVMARDASSPAALPMLVMEYQAHLAGVAR